MKAELDVQYAIAEQNLPTVEDIQIGQTLA